MENLVEKYNDLLNSRKFQQLSESEQNSMSVMLENQSIECERLLAEQTNSQAIAQFVPIMMPLVRRVMPALVINHFLGVQPLTTPTGFIFALNYRYTGTTDNSVKPNNGGQIIEMDVSETDKLKVGDSITLGATQATVVHVEPRYILIDKNTVKYGDDAKIKGVYSNEASFEKVLKEYSGKYETSKGESLSTDMNEMGITVDKIPVVAGTRKLKAKYTIEMYQDLKSVHGLMADQEIIDMMSSEIESEMNREAIDFVNKLAIQTPDFQMLNIGARYEMEKFAHLGARIAQERRMIAALTRRGSGNVMIVSPRVAAVLESLQTFLPIGSTGQMTHPNNPGVIGTFDGCKVILDIFAPNDYITILYKGDNARDSMGFFAPYIPLSFFQVNDVESGQPAVFMMSRYAIEKNPLNAEYYGRTFNVDFNGINSLY